MPERPAPTLIVVNGPPSSGKSTLAEQLVGAVGGALVAKDPIKEQLWDTIPRPDALTAQEWTRQLGAAACDVLWTVAATAGPLVVVEAPFEREVARPKATAITDRILEVHITGDPRVLHDRYQKRRPERHPCHEAVSAPTLEDMARQLRERRPLDLGPVLTVDTTGDDDPQAHVEAWVRGHLDRWS